MGNRAAENLAEQQVGRIIITGIDRSAYGFAQGVHAPYRLAHLVQSGQIDMGQRFCNYFHIAPPDPAVVVLFRIR